MRKPKRDGNFSWDLFDQPQTFRLVRIGASAARKKADDIRVLEGMLLECEPMYPAIDSWYKEKVLPGLKTGERVAYLAYEGATPVASAVLKLGEHSKFCHVRIRDGFRDLNLGRMIFTQMAFQVRQWKGVKDNYFTLPESLWNEKLGFFASFGFEKTTRSTHQYRVGEEELFCSAPASEVWKRSRENLHLIEGFTLGGFSLEEKVLISMQPKYAELVFSGEKMVEIRRKFPRMLRGKQAVVYGTQPLGSLLGEVTLNNITPGTPDQIWFRFGQQAGCTHDEYSKYVGNSTEVFAIELSNKKPYLAPVGIPQLTQLIKQELHPPQSYLRIRMDQASPWEKAITVAGLLHSWR